MWTGSRLSRFCAHSHLLADLNPRPTRDAAAKKGTIFHAALDEWRSTGIVPAMADPDVAKWLAIMVENNWAWPDGCELEKAWGLSHWGTFVAVEETAPGSHEYRSLDGEELMTAGRSDAVWMSPGEIIVSNDWKTGRTMAEPARINLQVNAAGIAHCQRWKAAAYVPSIYYARSGVWDVGEVVWRGSPQWDAALADIEGAAALDDKPHPGDHCGNCWERKNCAVAA